MTTTEPTYKTSPPTYLTDEYEIVKDGRTYLCQQVEYYGDVYEMCREVDPKESFWERTFRGKGIGPGDAGYDELVAYLDHFLIPRDQVESE